MKGTGEIAGLVLYLFVSQTISNEKVIRTQGLSWRSRG